MTALQRFYDWPERLDVYIRERETRRFKWGKDQHDCCSFALGSVIATTGYDAMAEIEDYVSAEEADLILDKHPIEAFMDEHFPPRALGMAQRGDIALVRVKEELALMIVEGPQLVGAGAYALTRYPRAAIIKAWAV